MDGAKANNAEHGVIAGSSMIFVLARAVTYSALFIGFLLIFLSMSRTRTRG
jgi:hypothetical protein